MPDAVETAYSFKARCIKVFQLTRIIPIEKLNDKSLHFYINYILSLGHDILVIV